MTVSISEFRESLLRIYYYNSDSLLSKTIVKACYEDLLTIDENFASVFRAKSMISNAIKKYKKEVNPIKFKFTGDLIWRTLF